MFAAPSNAAAQLVKLREAESFGRFDHHDGGVGYIDADLDDRSGHHDIRLAALELAHRFLLVFGFHLAVADRRDVFRQREVARDGFVAVLQIFVVHRFGLLDKRIDDINLSSLLDLLPHETEEPQAGRVGVVHRADRLTSRRQLVDHRNVQVAVEGHRQRAGNGRGGHHQDMGRLLVLRPEPCPLFDAEAMLFVDHHESQVRKLYPVFDQGVRADQQVDRAVGNPGEGFAPFACFGCSGKDRHPHVHSFEHPPEGGVVLARKDFGRSHHAGLEAVIDGQQHGHQRDEGLAAAHVALQQAVHLVAGDRVLPDLLDHALLCPGQRERQPGVEEGIEYASHFGEEESVVFRQAGRAARLDTQLNAE